MTRLFVYLILVLAAGLAPAEEPLLERWDRTVCLLTERKSTDGLSAVSSAFLVRYQDNTILVSAGHSASDTNTTTRITYRRADGESRWIFLSSVVNSESDPWHNFENFDLATAQLRSPANDPAPLKELSELAIPFDNLAPQTPNRRQRIEVSGYPLSLGATAPVSPLVMLGHVASRESPSDARWGKETVFYASVSVPAGTSGGPVFLSVDDNSSTDVVGMYIGFVSDANGGRLSKIIPAHFVRKAIEKHCTTVK